MDRGDRVRIYHDPFTRGSKEGEAILLKKYRDAGFFDGQKYESWEVRFIGDTHISLRKLSENDIVRK